MRRTVGVVSVIIALLLIAVASIIALGSITPNNASKTNSATSSSLATTTTFLVPSYSASSTATTKTQTGSTPPSETSTFVQTSNSLTSSSSETNNGSSPNDFWPTYHQNLQRDGVYNSQGLRIHNPALKWSSPTLDGAVYAEPLIVHGSVIAATENNSVYALNESTGDILWRANLGQPVPRSNLPCGDINPTGITGTPVVDVATRTIYVVGFLMPGIHELFALSLTTGTVIFHQNVNPQGVSPLVEQQRGALALSDGVVYIPYGGLAGDCGQYHGYVVGINTNQSGALLSYQVPTGVAGGVWAPSGLSIDSSGDLFIATGNSESSSTFDYGNSVIKLSPSLLEIDYFAPNNWLSLNQGDTDVGSLAPSIVGNDTVFQIGKEGVGYLLNESHLGGIGGELFSSHICSGAFGGTAFEAPYLYVPCINGLYALTLNLSSLSHPTFSVMWNTIQFDAGPPIVAGGAVWSLDNGSGTLYAFSPSNGSVIFQAHVGNVMRFSTPSAADEQIFIAASDKILSYSITT
ncbi:MAG TPA: PQQ-binding-like beta-propeller repeat protein [Nitrososphaerales archaeon]|nr:PQQ-binding-like beta-propeller repeat protein [Nitrososphaerales archaeon]